MCRNFVPQEFFYMPDINKNYFPRKLLQLVLSRFFKVRITFYGNGKNNYARISIRCIDCVYYAASNPGLHRNYPYGHTSLLLLRNFCTAAAKLRVVFTREPKVECCTLLFVLRNPSAAKVATGGCESVHTQGASFAAAVMLQVSISVLTS
ncbi:hypothetical protein ANN_07118 [Periplaneta americana]|uniref:Uncharacterized protein n=1 Tax=Periplaneta americana TaxID=6978 RepID=A0ABQ8TGB4_PERAM|nr:hypothetical protein ANN_07118 [Periplaneta americana]